MSFCHLHVHSEYSLLDGACRVKAITEKDPDTKKKRILAKGLIDRAKELGQDAIAITDHGAMYGVIDFYDEAKEQGIKPIIGCEVYVAPRTRFDKEHGTDNEYCHLVLLCENNTGYQNLIKMVSKAWTEGFYIKPRIDHELLEKYHEGLIALSACLAGEIPRALMANDYESAKKTAMWYRDLFGKDNYYLELQDHGIPDQKAINPQIVKLSKELDIPLVCTNDAHYLEKEDAEAQRILLCIQTGSTLENPPAMAFETDEFYVKSEEEMRSLFPEVPEAADNTVKIAERCHVEFEFGHTKLPRFDAPGGDSTAYFRKLCEDGLVKRFGTPSQELRDRLHYEMEIIESMGYVNYYLIVYDYVHYAKTHDIPVGPGRGSGAGSLCAYCIGITNIDPMKYNLLFERFLNPERVSMPDFDVDFSDTKRQQVVDYVIEKYGADHVSQIVPFGTLKPRAAVRDVARVMGLPYSVSDKVAKLIPTVIPDEKDVTLDKALKFSKELRELYESDETVKTLIEKAKKVEGMPRHASTHAAGVVITDLPVAEYVPLCMNGDLVAAQYNMTNLERLGLLKMDFLGLSNLSIIENAQKLIQKKNPDFDIENISFDEPKVYQMLAQGQCSGVFQLESSGMRRMLVQMKPRNFEDIISAISLYRPGPMDYIPQFVQNRNHPELTQYLTPQLEPILKATDGVVIYQEQVMQIFRSLAGYSLGRADIVRKAMSKKKKDVLEREREVFINGLEEEGSVKVDGCVRRGVSANLANELFNQMSTFAEYAFNKSHAAAYAVVAYRTAYLKCMYPQEYMAALLTSSLMEKGKVPRYMEECHQLGIQTLPPSINHSFSDFSVEGDNIRFGLLAIKNMGRAVSERIAQEREENGPYTSFSDFTRRMVKYQEFNRRAMESLIKCGALDELEPNRNRLLMGYSYILETCEELNKRTERGQLGFFDEEDQSKEYELPYAEEMSQDEKFEYEKEITGLYLSGHPLSAYNYAYEDSRLTPIDQIFQDIEDKGFDAVDGKIVAILSVLDEFKSRTTKQNRMMATAVAEDCYGTIGLLVFDKAFALYEKLLREGGALLLFGRISAREDEEAKLVVEHVVKAPAPGESLTDGLNQLFGNKSFSYSKKKESMPQKKSLTGLFLKVSSLSGDDWNRCKDVLSNHQGNQNVYLRCMDTGKMLKVSGITCAKQDETMMQELRNILGKENVAFQ
ncbi:MAG: DNA polymerase III subunit alpha [Clostridia bacterium]|nr:DNA polymerase III subunit alpha [Clostridia bacterium]